MLEAVGLQPAEEQIYRALLRLPAASPGELADRLGTTVEETTVSLRELVASGLVNRAPGAGHRFRAAPPDLAFGPLVWRRQQELTAIESAVHQLTSEYRRRLALRGAGELIEVVSGAQAIGQRVEQVNRIAKREVCSFIREPGFAVAFRDGTDLPEPAEAPAAVRAIYPRAVLEAPGDPYRLVEAVRNGEQARIVAESPLQLVLADRSLALVSLLPEDGDDEPSAVLVHPSGLLDALAALFEMTWAGAVPLVADNVMVTEDAAGTAPSTEDLRLLSLLLAGLTDQTIAVQLGLSTRTVQRRVRDLIELAGVRTRLQLVWQAAHRGWI